jgi:hypothetical protein
VPFTVDPVTGRTVPAGIFAARGIHIGTGYGNGKDSAARPFGSREGLLFAVDPVTGFVVPAETFVARGIYLGAAARGFTGRDNEAGQYKQYEKPVP